jgi:hypothetical protein
MKRGMLGWVVLLVIVLVAIPAGANTPTAAQLAAAQSCPWAACGEVLKAVDAGTKIATLPENLSPSLASATSDIVAPPGMAGCVLWDQSRTSSAGPCIFNPGQTKRMVLFGDSHAFMWSTAMADVAKANGYSLLFLSKISCWLPDMTFYNALTDAPNTACSAWRTWAIGQINQFKPTILVAATLDLGNRTSGDVVVSQRTYAKALTATLKELSVPGRQVVLLGDMPYLAEPGPSCLAAHESNIQSCSTATNRAVLATNQAAEHDAATNTHTAFVNTVPWFCTPKQCPAVISGHDVYANLFHITSTYAMTLEPVLAQALGLAAP